MHSSALGRKDPDHGPSGSRTKIPVNESYCLWQFFLGHSDKAMCQEVSKGWINISHLYISKILVVSLHCQYKSGPNLEI